MAQLLPYSHLHSYLCGLDRLTGEIMGFAFEKAAPEAVQGASGADQSLEFNKVESYEQLANALSVDAKAEARFGLFGADASFSFERTMSINSYSIFVYALASVKRAFRQVEDPKYKAEAVELAKGEPRAFREAYGDWFVRGMATGGELLSLIEIRTRDETERSEIDAALSGSYGINFSGEVKTKENFEAATAGKSTHIVQHQVGGTPATISNPEDVFPAVNKFVAELSSPDCQTAVSYQIGYVDYSTVPIVGAPSWIDVEAAEETLTQLADLRKGCIRTRADVQYVLLNQTEFDLGKDEKSKESWLKTLNEARTALSERIDAIQVKARAIAKDVTTPVSDLGALMDIPIVDLPQRNAGAPKSEPPVPPPPEPPPASPEPVPISQPEPAAPGTGGWGSGRVRDHRDPGGVRVEETDKR
jgi:hypothetical protein